MAVVLLEGLAEVPAIKVDEQYNCNDDEDKDQNGNKIWKKVGLDLLALPISGLGVADVARRAVQNPMLRDIAEPNFVEAVVLAAATLLTIEIVRGTPVTLNADVLNEAAIAGGVQRVEVLETLLRFGFKHRNITTTIHKRQIFGTLDTINAHQVRFISSVIGLLAV